MILTEIQAAFCNEIRERCEIQVFNTSFGVKDGQDNAPVYITNLEDADFQVINPENKTVYFLPIDECIFDSKDGQKCDFSLCSGAYFVLVDIKDVKKKKRIDAKKDAIDQLQATLIKIAEKIDTSQHQIFAVIGLTFLQNYPAIRTRKQNAQLRFDEYDAILLEGNAFSFETVKVQKLI